MAVRADPRVNLLAPLQRLAIPGTHESGVVEPRFVVRQGRGKQRRRRLQFPRTGRSTRSNLEDISHEIQKLLPPSQLIHLASGHQRSGLRADFLDFASIQRHRFAETSRVPHDKPLRRAFDNHARECLTTVEHYGDGLETLADFPRRLQDREHDLRVRFVRGNASQIRSEADFVGILPGTRGFIRDNMAAAASQQRLMKGDRAALRVAFVPRRGRERRRRLRQQSRFQRRP